MSRYNDIPEAFRRAMQEAGWREGDEGQGPPASAHPSEPWWTSRWLWLIVLALIIIASFNWIVTTYTEWLWFSERDFQGVWLRQWGAQIIAFLAFFLLAAVVLLLNWHLARRRAMRPPEAGVQILNLPGIGILITAAALFFSFVMGQAASARWETFLRYFYRVPFGTVDPVYGRDLSFYIFELPVYGFLRGWFMPLIFVALLGTAAIYVVNNLPSLQGRQLRLRALPHALRRHGAILLAIFFLLWAAGYWFNLFDLLYSSRGVAFGASYTDLHATRPALWIQMGLMTLVAAAVAYLAVRPDPRPALVAAGLWFIGTVALTGIYPGLLQRYAVEPNELSRERPYIEYNIEFTQFGFGLDEVQRQTLTPDVQLTAQDFAENEVALRNIRLWDYRPLLQTYRQLQELRPYYRFADVDVDRYEVEGETRQVMLSARELDKSGLSSPTWVNQKLEFTHGYGIVMNPVDRITAQGRPFFYLQDLPPRSPVGLSIERPQLYYGELSNDVVYAGSGLEEFDYPSGEENVYTTYEGSGGVSLENTLQRLAFAIRFADPNLLLSQYIDEDTRVMFHRQIQQRIEHITPFLWQDHDPYVVAADGRLYWIVDAYTVSDDLPYSQPFVRPPNLSERTASAFTVPDGVNYIRNAVKIVIDAYTGEVNYYVADADDPLIQTYDRVFPDLFQPMSEMPASLLEHVRYPEGLFLIQTQQYLKYHMEDVQVFYNEEDLWQIPNEIFDGQQQPIEPYYVTFSLPGSEDPAEFLLIQPYSPSTRDNMIAWIAGRSDPPNYGELHSVELPKQELVFGPIQVEARIDQEPAISQQFSLWGQRGSRVIRGNLLVIPINNSFLYVEPIYLQSESTALPELKRVILAAGESIVMRETLDGALVALLEEAPAVDEIVAEPPVEGGQEGEPTPEEGEEAPSPTPAPATEASVEELIFSANEHFSAAEAAQRNGDWSTYGRELELLQDDLQRLMELRGGQTQAAPTTVPTPAP